MLRYIVCILYKCVVHALALLDCLVASFINYAQVHFETRFGCLYNIRHDPYRHATTLNIIYIHLFSILIVLLKDICKVEIKVIIESKRR